MIDRDDLDRELAAHYATERGRDLERTPPFGFIRAGRATQRRPRIWSPVLAAGLLLLIALGAYLLRPRSGVPAGVNLKAVEWTSPTDFLLEIAGTEFLEKVPDIGGTAGWPSLELPAAGAARSEMRRNQL